MKSSWIGHTDPDTWGLRCFMFTYWLLTNCPWWSVSTLTYLYTLVVFCLPVAVSALAAAIPRLVAVVHHSWVLIFEFDVKVECFSALEEKQKNNYAHIFSIWLRLSTKAFVLVISPALPLWVVQLVSVIHQPTLIEACWNQFVHFRKWLPEH